ncbi:MAG: atpG [Candidatus Saccharibacteria bacterium]|nr:atpG [Candidatus Saccharibacteria bacterium]MDB5180247.1 atpG [Candidatus Saccharibacteria bacterium]
MANTQGLKQRIRSVKSTRQITKAMQLVAASKMRKAQEATKASSPYTLAARELLAAISTHNSVKTHPLFATRKVNSRLIILIASDKGLAGAYNSNIIKVYTNEVRSDEKAGVKNQTLTVGKKAAQFVSRVKNINVIGSYEELPDRPDGSELRAILNTARELFVSGDVDAVDVIYTDYVTSITQVAKVQRVLPAGFEDDDEPTAVSDATYEPSTEEVLNGIAYRLVGAQLFQALLDSRASEYSMRMIAMKNATDNASDLIDDLSLAMNKARQGAITQELAEISAGAEALNE